MARFRSIMLVLLAFLLVNLLLYHRMWTLQMGLVRERRNRGVFEKLYNEAMDEAAHWRKRYDTQLSSCELELEKLHHMTETLQKKLELLHKQEANGKLMRQQSATTANSAAA